MNPFGGSPKCPTCDKNVYAAEQVMGPGRRIYHKPCLKCVTCSRRLDSLSLLEHNQEPYCKSCHVKNFGTRDLRSANLTSSTPPISPARVSKPSPITKADSLTSSYSISEEPSEEEASRGGSSEGTPEHPNRSESPIPRTTSPPATFLRPTPSERTTSPPPSASQGVLPPNGDTARPLSPTKTSWAPNTYSARPLSPTATGLSTASAPAYLRQTATGSGTDKPTRPLKQSFTGNVGVGSRKTFGPSPGFGGTPNCPRCGKAVYFAEQVKASGRTWHKPCLRCTECSVLLDSTRLTEKDGVVMCRSCYSKLHGPQGSGYALLGRAG